MKKFKSKDFIRGWIIGDFTPSIIKTKNFEVCYRTEVPSKIQPHYHKKGEEITIVLRGESIINNESMISGDIFVLYPNEIVQGEIIKETEIIVIRPYSDTKDKYDCLSK